MGLGLNKEAARDILGTIEKVWLCTGSVMTFGCKLILLGTIMLWLRKKMSFEKDFCNLKYVKTEIMSI